MSQYATNRVTEYRYNLDGRLVEPEAHNSVADNQVTTWTYGTTLADSGVASKDLLRFKTYPDSTGSSDRVKCKYDRLGELIELEDQNGTVHSYTYDKLGRLTSDKVPTFGSGIDQAVKAIGLTYDPRGYIEKITSYSDTALTTVVDEVKLAYNGIDGSSATVGYDGAGNMTVMPKVGDWNTAQDTIWDAWNRMVEISEDTEEIGAYAYDGLTRRVTKLSEEDSSPVTRHYYYSDQWQILEERTGSNTTADRQCIWGLRYIDDLVLRDRFEGVTSDQRLYVTHDQWHVTAITNDAGAVQERYAYRAFGDSIVLTPSFGDRATSDFDWETMFGAYRWERDSNLYYVRHRNLSPPLGRWLIRDPELDLAERASFEKVRDSYYYCLNSPTKYVDIHGLRAGSQNGTCLPSSRVGGKVPARGAVRGAGVQAALCGLAWEGGWALGTWITENNPEIEEEWGDLLFKLWYRVKKACTDCSRSKLARLQRHIHNVCDTERTCEGITDCNTIRKRINRNKECVFARLRVQVECFPDSPDPGHEEAIDLVLKALRNCTKALKDNGCN